MGNKAQHEAVTFELITNDSLRETKSERFKVHSSQAEVTDSLRSGPRRGDI